MAKNPFSRTPSAKPTQRPRPTTSSQALQSQVPERRAPERRAPQPQTTNASDSLQTGFTRGSAPQATGASAEATESFASANETATGKNTDRKTLFLGPEQIVADHSQNSSANNPTTKVGFQLGTPVIPRASSGTSPSFGPQDNSGFFGAPVGPESGARQPKPAESNRDSRSPFSFGRSFGKDEPAVAQSQKPAWTAGPSSPAGAARSGSSYPEEFGRSSAAQSSTPRPAAHETWASGLAAKAPCKILPGASQNAGTRIDTRDLAARPVETSASSISLAKPEPTRSNPTVSEPRTTHPAAAEKASTRAPSSVQPKSHFGWQKPLFSRSASLEQKPLTINDSRPDPRITTNKPAEPQSRSLGSGAALPPRTTGNRPDMSQPFIRPVAASPARMNPVLSPHLRGESQEPGRTQAVFGEPNLQNAKAGRGVQTPVTAASASTGLTQASSAQASSVQALPVQPNTIPAEQRCFFDITQLIANVTEAYTVALFIADNERRVLRSLAYHTLSREFIANAEIAFGSGLVGWTAQNGARVSVCPFEHDSATLLYYSRDQALKSFIAVPVLAAQTPGANTRSEPQRLLGVIACDSKRSYAFAKLTEKILLDCARQVAHLIELQGHAAASSPRPSIRQHETLGAVLDKLRSFQTEQDLLNFAATLPQSVVERDALVVIATAEGGVGAGKFYPASIQQELQSAPTSQHRDPATRERNDTAHRLMQAVCKHKKLLSGPKSVHALPVDDLKQRSFLSIPFRVLSAEAGSLNLLSRPREAFDSSTIAAIERIAEVVGSQLEAIRLRERALVSTASDTILTWKQFSVKAQVRINEAKKSSARLTALRLSFQGLGAIERLGGIDVATEISARLARLLSQSVRAPAMSCVLYGAEFFVLCDSAEAEGLLSRFDRLLARVCNEEFRDAPLVREAKSSSGGLTVKRTSGSTHNTGNDIGSVLRHSLLVASASYPHDGNSIGQLADRCRERLSGTELSSSSLSASSSLVHPTMAQSTMALAANMGEVANARSK